MGKVWITTVKPLKADYVCRGCGKSIRSGREHCSNCMIGVSAQQMREIARVGRIAASTPEANVKRTATQCRNAIARNSRNPASQPKWLTEQAYAEKIQPLLAGISGPAIAKAIGVTCAYAGRIRQGRCRAHPRHWLALAELVSCQSK